MNRLHLAVVAALFTVNGCDTNRDHVPAGGAAPPAGGTAPAITDDPAGTDTGSTAQEAATSNNGNNTPRTSP